MESPKVDRAEIRLEQVQEKANTCAQQLLDLQQASEMALSMLGTEKEAYAAESLCYAEMHAKCQEMESEQASSSNESPPTSANARICKKKPRTECKGSRLNWHIWRSRESSSKGG